MTFLDHTVKWFWSYPPIHKFTINLEKYFSDTVKCFWSYPSNRKLTVNLDNYFSGIMSISCAVSHESILCALLILV